MGALPIKRYITKNDTVYERFEDGTATRDGAPIIWVRTNTRERVEHQYQKLRQRGEKVSLEDVEKEFLNTILYKYPQSNKIKRSSGIIKYENLRAKDSEIQLHFSNDDKDDDDSFLGELGLALDDL